MNRMRTEVELQKSNFKIKHSDVLMSIGSCFSESIGEKLQLFKFNIDINPFGQQYNPLSICNALQRLLSSKPFTADDVIYRNELYQSFQHHSDFSGVDAGAVLKQMNERLQQASMQLKNATHLFLTFGTANVFRLKSTGEVVSSCHKLPAAEFEMQLVNPKIIFSELKQVFELLWKQNENLKIILTVSPVRYFAFGMHENTVSKSYLFAAIQFLQEAFEQLYYFPAYEMLMDDLRDYRFYADDMLHPSKIAIEYVWQKLSETFFDLNTEQLIGRIEKINAAINHRPRNSDTSAHKKFIADTLIQIEIIEKAFSLNFEKERQLLIK